MRKNDNQLVSDKISQVFYTARGQSHQEILDRVSKYVWQSDAYKRLPRYRKEYYQGVIDTKWRELEKGLTSFVLLDDKLILPSDVPTGHWARVKPGGGRYWADTMKRYDYPDVDPNISLYPKE